MAFSNGLKKDEKTMMEKPRNYSPEEVEFYETRLRKAQRAYSVYRMREDFEDNMSFVLYAEVFYGVPQEFTQRLPTSGEM